MANPTISQIKVGNITYDLCDSTIRNSLYNYDHSSESYDNKGFNGNLMRAIVPWDSKAGADVPDSNTYASSIITTDKTGISVYYAQTSRTSGDVLYRSSIIQRNVEGSSTTKKNGFYFGINQNNENYWQFAGNASRDTLLNALGILPNSGSLQMIEPVTAAVVSSGKTWIGANIPIFCPLYTDLPVLSSVQVVMRQNDHYIYGTGSGFTEVPLSKLSYWRSGNGLRFSITNLTWNDVSQVVNNSLIACTWHIEYSYNYSR